MNETTKEPNDKDGGSESPSPEFLAFEEGLKGILKVSKKEIDRRERDYNAMRKKEV